VSLLTRELVGAVLSQYRLPVVGIHGPTHWARVLENGRRLSTLTGGDVEVVELFALFHDACRRNESFDPGHGRRGAELAVLMRGPLLPIAEERLALLRHACALHTDGRTEGDLTVLTCWDADRLDLGRVGITPRPSRLCTDAARDSDVIDWAQARAWSGFVPAFLRLEWGLGLP
jgi:uncharacterized protein